MSGPAFVVRLGLEEPARVVLDATTESEALRLLDWVGSHAELAALLAHALDVLEAERAA